MADRNDYSALLQKRWKIVVSPCLIPGMIPQQNVKHSVYKHLGTQTW